MFILMSNEHRVNLNGIFQYKPYSKYNPLISDKTYYYIKIEYLNGKIEELSFINNEEKRDKFLKFLDENLLDSKE